MTQIRKIKCGQCQNEITVCPENSTMLYSHWYAKCGTCGHLQRFNEYEYNTEDYTNIVTY